MRAFYWKARVLYGHTGFTRFKLFHSREAKPTLQFTFKLLGKDVSENRDGRREKVFASLGHNPCLKSQIQRRRGVSRIYARHSPVTRVIRINYLADQRVKAWLLSLVGREVHVIGPCCSAPPESEWNHVQDTSRWEIGPVEDL